MSYPFKRFLLIDDPEQPPFFQNMAKLLWLGVIAAFAGVFLLFVVISFSNLPSLEQLENPKSENASEIIGDNGEVVRKLFIENRVPLTFEQLSPVLIKALLATEDERFYQHTGIDFKAVGRTFVKTILLSDESAGGASTITQQLAKQLFTGKRATSKVGRTIQKLKEWVISLRLERRYTKNEIIAMYLNKFSFNNNAFGIKAASEIYFGKPQDSLALHEAATLIGMLKNSNLFNPLRRPDTTLHRRMVVLKQMEKNGFISASEYEEAKNKPIGIHYTPQSHTDGIATYFAMEMRKDLKELLGQEQYLKSDGTPYDIDRDGLKIFTTINPAMQRIAEETMAQHMAKVQSAFFRLWRNRDPWTYKSNSDLEIPLWLRQKTFTNLVQASDRYQALRVKILGPTLEKITEQIPESRFHQDDREIEWIMEEVKKQGSFSDMIKQNIITAERAATLRKIMQSGYFAKLQDQWELLQNRVEEEFHKPAKMKVFTYNDRMETDTVMSPYDSVRYHRMFLQTGILAVSPINGEIKVWVGGINHKYFQYDHIRINRQVGSTFKPFVYATAIAQQGFSPCFQVVDMPYSIVPGEGNFNLIKPWTPVNSKGSYTNRSYSLKEALRNSVNTVSVFLMKQLGDAKHVQDMVAQMGISRDRIPVAPSICLGAADLSVFEMTGAYATFANNGIFNEPFYIKRIEDRNGRVIFQHVSQERSAIQPNANYVMVEMLRHAGSSNMAGIKSDIGGKTGTTNDYVDGWFMGITPNLVVGTWVGGEDRWLRFLSLDQGQGSAMAKPFFREFIKRLEGDPSIGFDVNARFYRPSGDIGIELDCSKFEVIKPANGEEFGREEFGDDIFADENIEPHRQ